MQNWLKLNIIFTHLCWYKAELLLTKKTGFQWQCILSECIAIQISCTPETFYKFFLGNSFSELLIWRLCTSCSPTFIHLYMTTETMHLHVCLTPKMCSFKKQSLASHVREQCKTERWKQKHCVSPAKLELGPVYGIKLNIWKSFSENIFWKKHAQLRDGLKVPQTLISWSINVFITMLSLITYVC